MPVFSLLCLLLAWPFYPVTTAGIIVASNVVIGGPYGRLTAQTNMDMASLTTYANGTIYFDIQTYEHGQRIYQFNVESYGNGTMQIRFLGERPSNSVANQAATNVYVNNPGWQQVTYTANIASAILTISFLPSVAFAASTATYVLAMVMGLVAILAVLNRMQIIGSHKGPAGPLTFTQGLQHSENRAFFMLILLAIIGIFIAALFATIFKGLGG